MNQNAFLCQWVIFIEMCFVFLVHSERFHCSFACWFLFLFSFDEYLIKRFVTITIQTQYPHGNVHVKKRFSVSDQRFSFCITKNVNSNRTRISSISNRKIFQSLSLFADVIAFICRPTASTICFLLTLTKRLLNLAPFGLAV